MKTEKHLLAPGIKPTLELLRTNPEKIIKIYLKTGRQDQAILQLHALCSKNSIPIEEVSGKELEKLCENDKLMAHQGVVAKISALNEKSLSALLLELDTAPLPLILALDQVKDPRNLGALARSAYALGAAGILFPIHNNAGASPAAIKASAGALFHLPICAVTNLARALDMVEEQGVAIFGAGPHADAQNPYIMEWELPLALVLGSEKSGMRPGVAKRCQKMVEIPFARHFDSLNIAQAGGMLLALCAAEQWRKHELP